MRNEEVKDLAEKIAHLISTEKKTDLSSLFASVEKLNHRLDKLEQKSANPGSSIPDLQAAHPSQERFSVPDAIVDAIFDLNSKEKACTFEPNGKPCDHCSMCSARGF